LALRNIEAKSGQPKKTVATRGADWM